MKRTILSAIALFFLSVSAFSQIKVKSTGKVIIGEDRTADDGGNVLSTGVFGPLGTYRTGSKLAFGDFGTYANFGWNVFIGEYGTGDSDQLWLHGKKGIYLTTGGAGSDIIGFSSSKKFYFNDNVYSKGYLLSSDKRLKTDINDLTKSLDNLVKLKGVSYYFKVDEDSIIVTNSTGLTDKEKKDKDFFAKQKADEKNNRKLKLGLIAQDVQQVFPNLVEEDSSGFLSLDYIGLIPVIIEALKEQQLTIDLQEKQISEILKVINKKGDNKKSGTINNENYTGDSNAFSESYLMQNSPNPFTKNTTIKYIIPNESLYAAINIFDMRGMPVKNIELGDRGNGEINISGNELNAGMYIYTLIVDGVFIDSKNMVLTK